MSQYVFVTSLAHGQTRLGKGTTMEDFPIWLKLLIWLILGGTIAYAVGAAIYTSMMG
jgi:hypothetical protein